MPTGASTPIFVDDSGRRRLFVRVLGWLVGGLVTAYLGLLGVSLVGGPGVVPLALPAIGHLLPGPAAALLAPTSDTHHRTPGDVLATTSATPAPVADSNGSASGATRAPSATTTAPTPRSTSRPRATPTASPSARPTASATPASRSTNSPNPHSSTARGHQRTSPTPKSTR